MKLINPLDLHCYENVSIEQFEDDLDEQEVIVNDSVIEQITDSKDNEAKLGDKNKINNAEGDIISENGKTYHLLQNKPELKLKESEGYLEEGVVTEKDMIQKIKTSLMREVDAKEKGYTEKSKIMPGKSYYNDEHSFCTNTNSLKQNSSYNDCGNKYNTLRYSNGLPRQNSFCADSFQFSYPVYGSYHNYTIESKNLYHYPTSYHENYISRKCNYFTKTHDTKHQNSCNYFNENSHVSVIQGTGNTQFNTRQYLSNYNLVQQKPRVNKIENSYSTAFSSFDIISNSPHFKMSKPAIDTANLSSTKTLPIITTSSFPEATKLCHNRSDLLSVTSQENRFEPHLSYPNTLIQMSEFSSNYLDYSCSSTGVKGFLDTSNAYTTKAPEDGVLNADLDHVSMAKDLSFVKQYRKEQTENNISITSNAGNNKSSTNFAKVHLSSRINPVTSVIPEKVNSTMTETLANDNLVCGYDSFANLADVVHTNKGCDQNSPETSPVTDRSQLQTSTPLKKENSNIKEPLQLEHLKIRNKRNEATTKVSVIRQNLKEVGDSDKSNITSNKPSYICHGKKIGIVGLHDDPDIEKVLAKAYIQETKQRPNESMEWLCEQCCISSEDITCIHMERSRIMKPNPLNKHKMTMRKRQLTSDDVVALKKVKNIHHNSTVRFQPNKVKKSLNLDSGLSYISNQRRYFFSVDATFDLLRLPEKKREITKIHKSVRTVSHLYLKRFGKLCGNSKLSSSADMLVSSKHLERRLKKLLNMKVMNQVKRQPSYSTSHFIKDSNLNIPLKPFNNITNQQSKGQIRQNVNNTGSSVLIKLPSTTLPTNCKSGNPVYLVKQPLVNNAVILPPVYPVQPAESHAIVPNTFQPIQFLPMGNTEQTPLNQLMTSYYQQQFNVVPYPKQSFTMSKY